jgi:site-specific DNA-methyltransferase (adenine-specific)
MHNNQLKFNRLFLLSSKKTAIRIRITYMQGLDKIFCGDALAVLAKLPDESIDLIFTSPPYANQRKQCYSGAAPDEYVAWFIPIAAQLQRVLKPTGTFMLNIKENVVKCERSVYVLHLILALREQGWLWTEEWIWHKKNSVPGKWPNRFRDSWERLLQFNKQKQFSMYQETVMTPVGDWTKTRFKRLNPLDSVRRHSENGSPFVCQRDIWKSKSFVYPGNVLYLATESHNRHHPAAFPETLPTWFIRLFTQVQETVLDPFVGSGTTAVAAQKLNRHFIGIDIFAEYCDIARRRLADAQS